MAYSTRQSEATLTITDNVNTTCTIDMTDWDGGHFQLLSGNVVAITWWASVRGSTYLAAVDGNGTAVTQTTNNTNDFIIPTTLNGRRYLRPVAGSGTTGTMVVGVKRASMS